MVAPFAFDTPSVSGDAGVAPTTAVHALDPFEVVTAPSPNIHYHPFTPRVQCALDDGNAAAAV
jgi:hypothetical protein